MVADAALSRSAGVGAARRPYRAP